VNPAPFAAPSESFAPPRVAPRASAALGGIWRLTSRRFYAVNYRVTLAGLLAALAVFSIPATSSRGNAARDFLPWAAGFYVCFVVPILSFIFAAGAMRDDLGAASADYVFTRAVRRPVYLIFRYLTQVAVAQIDFLFALLVITGLGLYWQVPGLWPALPLILLGQVAAVFVFSATGMLCGLLTSRYVIVGLLYGAVVEAGLGNVPTQLSQISLVRHLVALVRPLYGDTDWSLTPGALSGTASIPATLAVLGSVVVIAVALCAMLFSLREFAGSASREG
jgi:ABC-2 type transport system permease protein